MAKSVLPNNEGLTNNTPEEILKYLNIDGLRQWARQTRLHLQLKPNKDADYLSNETLHKYSGDLHNIGLYQRMEIRTFPDNDAFGGYAGINVDSGEFGLVHNIELWDHGISPESLKQVINRTQIGAMAKVPGKLGYGLDDRGNISRETDNRQATILFDAYDGRAYLYSSDEPIYTNNGTQSEDKKLPLRTVARIVDIPTNMTDLKNDFYFVSDPDFHHSDNNFTHSNRYVLDNLDDRTFVYPEISKNRSGDYLENIRIGLSGEQVYGESDGEGKYNSQPDLGELQGAGDRLGEAINSYNKNKNYSGVSHPSGYLPGIFRSYEELERVDLVGQLRTPMTHTNTPGAKRPQMYYSFDGIWSPTWFDRLQYPDSYLAQSLHPNNMETKLPDRQPIPFSKASQTGTIYNTSKLYQWRYNRVTVVYHTKDIQISIIGSGENYKVDDILRWSFGDASLLYQVQIVGSRGQIQKGTYLNSEDRVLAQDPSTSGVGVPFVSTTGNGRGAKLAVQCPATISTHATQIKNNLYAYVDVVPSVRSDNTTIWSDVKGPDTQGGLVNVRSTAAYPAFSGINSGRGGPSPNSSTSMPRFHEHGGNATAGVHVHLFRYVIDTQNPTWVIKDEMQVFTGRWVDQGPVGGAMRPADDKALYLSNFNTNCYNNFYKFSVDLMIDAMTRVPDAVVTSNPNTTSNCRLHIAQRDPLPEQKFTEDRVNPDTSQVETIDITDKVLYVNGATGVLFMYNTTNKNDPTYGYASRPVGWYSLSGGISR